MWFQEAGKSRSVDQSGSVGPLSTERLTLSGYDLERPFMNPELR